MVDPTIIFKIICPDATSILSKPSSRLIGTAFGEYLGKCYIRDRKPQTYGLVDWKLFRGWQGWEGQGSLLDLKNYDLPVWTALTNSEWSRFPWRADILDADVNAIYEIKPVRSADNGPPQLQRYLTALNQFASTTADGSGTRVWVPGGPSLWDPRPYAMLIPGVGGGLCAICPWNDDTTPGLILYDIVCCKINSESEEMAAYLAETQLQPISPELTAFQPALTNWIGDQLPLAPINSMYVLLFPKRFFEAFVLIPRAMKSGRARQTDRLIEGQWGPKPGPAFTQFMIETWLLAHVLAGPVGDIPMVAGNWISPQEILRLYGAQALAGLAAGGLMAAAVAVPELLGLGAAAEAAEVPEVAEVAEELEALGADTTPPEVPPDWPGEPPPEPPGPNPYQDGSGVGGTEVGPSSPSWDLNPPPPPPPGGPPEAGAGLGVIGAFLIGAVTPDAQAGTGSNPPTGTALLGADPVYLLPAELVRPVTGEVALEQKVKLGDTTFYIGGIVTAPAPSTGGH